MTRLSFRLALVAVLVPFALAVTAVALQLAWLPDLPASVITHWAFDGAPDASAPSWTMPLLTGIVGVGIPALFGAILAAGAGPCGPTATHKLLAVASVFAVTLIGVGLTGSLAIQRGVADERPDVLPVVLGGLAAAFLLAAAGWFVLPQAVPGGSVAGAPVPVVPVAPGERVAWVGIARFGTGVLIALGGTVVLVTGVIVFAIAVTGSWWYALIPVVVALAVLGTSVWRVRVDGSGLTVRGALGWPQYRVALGELESAGVSEITPLGEFGGYGVRFGLGRRLGIVTRAGEALEVTRRDGRAVVVTVDDAATAAGLLNALAR
jgi:hypothetical protein